MRAAEATAFSSNDPASAVDVVDVAEPTPRDGEVLVTVRAASLNHHDLWSLRGVGVTEHQLPLRLGSDVAGVTDDGREVIVHSVVADPDRGNGDELLDPGRAMLAEAGYGCIAEKAVVPARNLLDKPPSLSFEEAACLPTAWLTAYRMLFVKASVKPGGTVLIQGAGGGVSTAAVILAASAGLRVWVAGRVPEKLDKARTLGADAVFGIGERLPERVDAVIDTVGAPTWDHSLKSVRPGGDVVVAGATGGATAKTDLFRVFLQQISIHGSIVGTRAELRSLSALCDARGIRPHIDSIFALDDARQAFERLGSGAAFGKVVVTP
jgi:NADPH:quinone reductase-like Zn-dependent oxidoreductase